jgi:hypothetical protein
MVYRAELLEAGSRDRYGGRFEENGIMTTCMIDLVSVCYIYLNDIDVTY